MVGSKIFITHAKQMPVTTEQRLRTFIEDHHPATIAFARSGDGELTVIEAATPEQAKKIVAALAATSVAAPDAGTRRLHPGYPAGLHKRGIPKQPDASPTSCP